MIHNSMFQNSNINNINDNDNNSNNNYNNNTEKIIIKNKDNNNIETPLNTSGGEMKNNNILQSYLKNKIEKEKINNIKKEDNNSIDSRKIIHNESDVITLEELNDDDEVINQINNGEIFSNIKLNYEVSDNDNVNSINNIKNIYSQKIDELEKSMENWKSYIEIYYRKKIEKINENGGIESIGLIDGESPVVKYTT